MSDLTDAIERAVKAACDDPTEDGWMDRARDGRNAAIALAEALEARLASISARIHAALDIWYGTEGGDSEPEQEERMERVIALLRGRVDRSPEPAEPRFTAAEVRERSDVVMRDMKIASVALFHEVLDRALSPEEAK
jgi:hypothetical protein